jgi:tetratricopeptide (TPR) repeat protein
VRTWRPLVLVFALALAVRVVVLVELSDSIHNELLLGDAALHDRWARSIAAGEVIGERVFFQAPLYPYLVGIVYSIVTPSPALVRMLQALGGALACTLVAAATRRAVSPRAGLLAGIALAFYAPAVWQDGLLQKESLAFLLTAALMFALARFRERPASPRAAAIGLCLGALALTRENAAVVALVVLPWMLLARHELARRERARWAGACLLAALVLPGLVGLRNLAVGGDFLPTTSNLGFNFYVGNHAGADGLYTPLAEGRAHFEYERDDAQVLAERELGRDLSPAEVSSYWLGRAWDWIAGAPLDWLRLLGRKLALTWNRAEIMDTEALAAYADESALLAALSALLGFGILAPLAAVGVWATWRARPELRVHLLCVLAIASSLTLFFVTGRFRLGMVPFLAPFAAAGVLALVEVVRAREVVRLALGFAVLLAAGAVVSAPLALAGDPRATTWSNVSSALLRLERYEEAGAWARRAAERDPTSADARYNLALALQLAGRTADAERAWLELLDLGSAYAAEAREQLGLLCERERRYAEAVRWYDATASGDSAAPFTSLVHLAFLLACVPDDAVRDGARALELARRAIALAATPAQRVQAQDALAASLAETGDFGEAARTASLAREAALANGDEVGARTLVEREALYRRFRPLRAPAGER